MSKPKKRWIILSSVMAVVIIVILVPVISWQHKNASDRRFLNDQYGQVKLPNYLTVQSNDFQGTSFRKWLAVEPFPTLNVAYSITKNITLKDARNDYAAAFQAVGYKVNPANYLNPTVASTPAISVSISFDNNQTNPDQVVKNLYVTVSKDE